MQDPAIAPPGTGTPRQPTAPATRHAPEESVAVSLRGLWKTYPKARVPAVADLSIDIRAGEIVTLLGPSGCGKSTTLRLVAGLEVADAGSIHFGDVPMADAAAGVHVAPDKRGIGMVFQSYAIWPNMTVEENVSFPLKARKYPRDEIKPRVERALDLVGMLGLERRPAPLLSGGQQQRVALARAVVTEPHVLLLDEPFSNLDAKLREQMRIEVKLLQERLGLAVLFVTHDQTEALGLSHRIAVMRDGVVQQFGSAWTLYEQPANEFVRDFVGKTLLFGGTIRSVDQTGQAAVLIDGIAEGEVLGHSPGADRLRAGDRVRVAIRPEDLRVMPATAADPPPGHMTGVAEAALYLGERVEYQVHVEGQDRVVIYGDRHHRTEAGSRIWLQPRPDGHSIWPSE